MNVRKTKDPGGELMPKQSKLEYASPTMKVEGTIQSLTLRGGVKSATNTPDGFTFQGIILTS